MEITQEFNLNNGLPEMDVNLIKMQEHRGCKQIGGVMGTDHNACSEAGRWGVSWK